MNEKEDLIKGLTDKLDQGMKELFDSQRYRDYLKTMSRFHNYSSRNVMLIHQQMPKATQVASFNLWKEQFNRRVKKGEKSIRIFAPIKVKTDKQKTDPKTNKPMFDEQGKPIMVEDIKFKPVPVFDVSQTDGAPLPELVQNLVGDVDGYENLLNIFKEVSPLPIVFEEMSPFMDGYCRFGEQIGIREGMSEVQTMAAIIHEMVHARLHDPTSPELTPENEVESKTRGLKEIEAESISYVVCQKLGIETAENAFGYLANWDYADISKLALETIRKEASSLIADIDEQIQSLVKREAEKTSIDNIIDKDDIRESFKTIKKEWETEVPNLKMNIIRCTEDKPHAVIFLDNRKEKDPGYTNSELVNVIPLNEGYNIIQKGAATLEEAKERFPNLFMYHPNMDNLQPLSKDNPIYTARLIGAAQAKPSIADALKAAKEKSQTQPIKEAPKKKNEMER